MVSDGDKFFAKILTHEGVDEKVEDVDSSENENFLKDLFEENRDQICKGASLAVELLPFGKWAKVLMKGGMNLATVDADRNIKDKDNVDEKLEDLIYAFDSKNNREDFPPNKKYPQSKKLQSRTQNKMYRKANPTMPNRCGAGLMKFNRVQKIPSA